MTPHIQIIIKRDGDPLLGHFEVVGIRRLNRLEQAWYAIRRAIASAFSRSKPLARFKAGLSVAVRMTTDDYAKIMGMAIVPDPEQGHATLDLIPTPNPTQCVGDAGVRI